MVIPKPMLVTDAIEEIPIKFIHSDDRFDRKERSDVDIASLAKSIKESGMHTEIWITEDEKSTVSKPSFTLVSGSRRLMAHKKLSLSTIRAKIIKANKKESAYLTVMENSNRVNYSPVEKMENFMYLLHLEFQEVYPSETLVFNTTRYLNATRPVVTKYMNAETGRKVENERPFTRDQKQIAKIIRKIFTNTGLFKSYDSLYRNYVIEDLSPEIRTFCVIHVLCIKGIGQLKRASRIFENKVIEMDARSANKLYKVKLVDKKIDGDFDDKFVEVPAMVVLLENIKRTKNVNTATVKIEVMKIEKQLQEIDLVEAQNTSSTRKITTITKKALLALNGNTVTKAKKRKILKAIQDYENALKIALKE